MARRSASDSHDGHGAVLTCQREGSVSARPSGAAYRGFGWSECAVRAV